MYVHNVYVLYETSSTHDRYVKLGVKPCFFFFFWDICLAFADIQQPLCWAKKNSLSQPRREKRKKARDG